MKAYQVSEAFEGHCVIVFASRAVVARREGANQLDVSFGEVDQCKRAPWADEYAPGPVPAQAKIAAGWYFECACGCERRIDSDFGTTRYEDDGDDGELNPMEPVYVGGGVYWNQRCKDNDEREQRERAEAIARDDSEVKAAVLAKFPFATEIRAFRGHAYVDGKPNYNTLQGQFRFPGGRWCANWIVGAETVGVQTGDVEAWLAAKAGGALDAAHG